MDACMHRPAGSPSAAAAPAVPKLTAGAARGASATCELAVAAPQE